MGAFVRALGALDGIREGPSQRSVDGRLTAVVSAANGTLPKGAGRATVPSMTETPNLVLPQKPIKHDRGIGIWLMIVAGFIALIVLVGGLTRLTDSGLSITEWKPVTGALPPLSHEAWLEEFEKYKQIPEYSQVNRGMTLAEFEWIYWWEWAHRQLARTVGFVFLLPMLWFMAKGRITRAEAPRFVVLFLLGGAQGALGWFMVASGLTDRVDVSQYRLAAHLSVAVLLFGMIFWTGLRYLTTAREEGPPDLAVPARLFIGLIFLQIVSGAFVAGIHAGHIYNTWPLMDGSFIPDGLYATDMASFEDHLTAQFNHRMLAYVVLAGGIGLWLGARTQTLTPSMSRALYVMLGALALQVGLGIATLLLVVPLPLAAAHQMGAIVLFAAAINFAFRLNPR